MKKLNNQKNMRVKPSNISPPPPTKRERILALLLNETPVSEVDKFGINRVWGVSLTSQIIKEKNRNEFIQGNYTVTVVEKRTGDSSDDWFMILKVVEKTDVLIDTSFWKIPTDYSSSGGMDYDWRDISEVLPTQKTVYEYTPVY